MQNRIKAALLVGSLAAGSAFAAVSPEQAAELGKTLTPMGAEMAGNADGSIPAWDPPAMPPVIAPDPINPNKRFASLALKILLAIIQNCELEITAKIATAI